VEPTLMTRSFTFSLQQTKKNYGSSWIYSFGRESRQSKLSIMTLVYRVYPHSARFNHSNKVRISYRKNNPPPPLLVAITLNLIISTDFKRMQQRRVLDKPIRSPDPDAPCQEFPNKNLIFEKKSGATQLYICHMAVV
jgi:hypothetical protein